MKTEEIEDQLFIADLILRLLSYTKNCICRARNTKGSVCSRCLDTLAMIDEIDRKIRARG